MNLIEIKNHKNCVDFLDAPVFLYEGDKLIVFGNETDKTMVGCVSCHNFKEESEIVKFIDENRIFIYDIIDKEVDDNGNYVLRCFVIEENK